MNLTIDTRNSKEVKVILEKEGSVIEEVSLSSNGRAESVINLLHRALEKSKTDVQEIKTITFEKGPGSYTGLKAGVAVANALSFALNIPINKLPVESFEVPVYD